MKPFRGAQRTIWPRLKMPIPKTIIPSSPFPVPALASHSPAGTTISSTTPRITRYTANTVNRWVWM